jgi:hypothetical protein
MEPPAASYVPTVRSPIGEHSRRTLKWLKVKQSHYREGEGGEG